MQGLNVCRQHGGYAQVAKLAGRRRVYMAELERRAERAADKADLVPAANPYEVTERLMTRVQFLVDRFLTDLEKIPATRYQSKEGTEQIRGEVEIVYKYMDLLRKLTVDYSKLPITDLKARIEKAQVKEVQRRLQAAVEECFDMIQSKIPLAYKECVGWAKAELPAILVKHLAD